VTSPSPVAGEGGGPESLSVVNHDFDVSPVVNSGIDTDFPVGDAVPEDNAGSRDSGTSEGSAGPEDSAGSGGSAVEGADLPAPPPGAAAVFGSALDQAVAFAGMLASRGVEQGLIGPHEVPRLWDRHLLNCAVVAELIRDRSRILVDIGSGAGLPGLVLAMIRPELDVILLEPMERRCRFLTECAAELGLDNASVLRGRAEETRLRADVATARAVAPLDRLAELAVGLVRPGGMVLAIKGRTAADELKKARPVLRRIGARGAEVVRAGQGKVDPATTVVRFFAR
jgi:16S rRNA (guanine527-N7)-methyltransferase